ncbi:MAG: selenocysteine-specific translation elongation factor [Chloroflexi bacterium]|nr:selenocysteine-specific translation elongation factor [Chloroflexota bacterium]
MRTIVVGTAGHIDHGKTSLLRALTGIDADRLPEERARGMTIDVGYAHLAFDDGVELDFVDVPGHDRLVGNMLVGAGEIDAALLVVAADAGLRPQTIEHLALLDALRVEVGLAVVTKTDVVPAERVAAVVEGTEALLGRTGLARATVVAASAATGAGLEAVRDALRQLRDDLAERPPEWPSPPRLAIDRAFTVQGRGAVVTGTLRGGPLEAGETVRLEPAGRSVRIREVQVHGHRREANDGGRTALNLAGITASELQRGDVLVLDVGAGQPQVGRTGRLLVELTPPPSIVEAGPWPPRDAEQLRLHIGTAAVEATVGRRGREGAALADGRATARLALAEPVATFAGQRGVLRQGATGAIGGGVRILDPEPPRGVSRRRMTAPRLVELIEAFDRRDPGGVHAATLALHGALPDGAVLELAPDVREALRDHLLALVTDTARPDRLSRGLPMADARAALRRALRSIVALERGWAKAAAASLDGVLAELVASGELVKDGDRLRPAGVDAGLPVELAAAMARLEAALAVHAPPGLVEAAAAAGCPADGVRALQAAGRIVRLEADLAWATPTYHRLAARALEMARREPLTPAAFRDATASSRRYVLAILEDLDRRGILTRTAEGHVPGPRAPGAA